MQKGLETMRKIVLGMSIILLSILTASCAATSSSFEKALQNFSYTDAIELYNKAIGNIEKEQEFCNVTKHFLEEGLEKFSEGKIPFEEMNNRFLTVDKINQGAKDSLIDSYYLAIIQERMNNIVASKESFSQAEKAFQGGKFADAIIFYTKVSEDDTENYEAALQRRLEAIAKFEEETRKVVGDYVTQGQFDAAYSYLSIIEMNAKYADRMDIWNDIYNSALSAEVNATIEQVNDKITTGDSEGALNLLIVILKREGVSSISIDIDKTITDAANAFVNQKLTEAGSIFESSGYESAINFLQLAENVLEKSEYLQDKTTVYQKTIRDKIAEYEEYIPVRLADMESYSRNSYISTSNENYCVDNYGNRYYEDTVIYNKSSGISSGTGKIEYFLGAKYSVLTGMYYVPYASRDPKYRGVGRLKIYGDDKLIFEKTISDNKATPISIELDIAGIKFLRIELDGGWYRGDGTGLIPYTVFAEGTVRK